MNNTFAHNCYPYEGQWTDRIDRALKNRFPIGIEQPGTRLVCGPGDGKGTPGSDAHLENDGRRTDSARALFRTCASDRRAGAQAKRSRAVAADRTPLRFQVARSHFVARRVGSSGQISGLDHDGAASSDPYTLGTFDPKPLLVLTEDADIQEQVFFREIPAGARLRVFGSAHTARIDAKTAQERQHLAATLPPEQLLIGRPTNYRRWWNNAWDEVEEGGQTKAGDWTPASAARLRALVDHAHRLGYWIRFYTLDGFAPAEDRGWGAGYNFGSRERAEARWKAAIDAGVNLIATDQYEDFGAFLEGVPSPMTKRLLAMLLPLAPQPSLRRTPQRSARWWGIPAQLG